MSDQQAINFYRIHDSYGEFSNIAAFPITILGTS